MLSGDGRRELQERRDVVGETEAAAIAGDDQIAVARMHENVVRANGRISVHERLPLLAGVHGNEKPEFRSRIQELPILRVFAYYLDVTARRKGARDAGEGPAVVPRDEDIRLEIVGAMAVHGDVRSSRVEVRRINARDPIR